MNLKFKCCFSFFVVLFFSFTKIYSQQVSLKFSQTSEPVLFGEGIISDGFDNRDMTISPSNDELFFTLQHRLFSTILYSKKINGQWIKPEIAWFSGKFNDLEPAFSPDGKKIFFTSNRPLSDTSSKEKDYDVWYLEKKENNWIGPFNAGTNINTDKDEFYPSIAKNGNLYFTRDHDEAKDDIFVSYFKNGSYQPAEVLPDGVNSKGYDFNAFIDPDEGFIIFSSYKRGDDLGGGDLYISARKDNQWQPPVHLNNPINSNTLDYSPFISFDGKYFFFTSKRVTKKFPLATKANLNGVKNLLFSAGNGSDDIYVMDSKTVLSYISLSR